MARSPCRNERGVTHIDALTEAMRLRRAEQFAYFAFDLLHLDGTYTGE